jgi:hypothetical protein
MSNATERHGQTGEECLSQITPDYKAWGPSDVAARPWYRELIFYLGRRTTNDLIVLGSFLCPTYLGVKVVEAADRVNMAGPVVLGIGLAVVAFGAWAFQRSTRDGQNCQERAHPPPHP